MRSALKATALLSSSSVVTVAVGLVTAKLWAKVVGPVGYGHSAVMQSAVGLLAVVAELGLSTTLVRACARPVTEGRRDEVRVIWRSASTIFLTTLAVVVGALVVLRRPIAGLLFGDQAYARDVLWASAMLAFNVAANIRIGILNAHHQVRTLAVTNVVVTVVSSAVAIAPMLKWGVAGIGLGLASGAVARWVIVSAALYRATGLLGPTGPSSSAQIRDLLRQGLPMTASLLVGPGTQIVLPVVVRHAIGMEPAGHFSAAQTIAVTFITFLLTSVGQDYYPRVSMARGDAPKLQALAREQHRLMMLVGVPLLLGIAWGSRWAIPLVMTRQFLPAVDVLGWQVIGELFRFSCINFTYIVLSEYGGMPFFVPALINGATVLASAWLLLPVMGVAGAGLAFAIGHGVYLVIVLLQVRRRLGWTLDARNALWLLAGAATLLLPNLLPATLDAWRGTLLFALLAVATALSLRGLLRVWRAA